MVVNLVQLDKYVSNPIQAPLRYRRDFLDIGKKTYLECSFDFSFTKQPDTLFRISRDGSPFLNDLLQVRFGTEEQISVAGAHPSARQAITPPLTDLAVRPGTPLLWSGAAAKNTGQISAPPHRGTTTWVDVRVIWY